MTWVEQEVLFELMKKARIVTHDWMDPAERRFLRAFLEVPMMMMSDLQRRLFWRIAWRYRERLHPTLRRLAMEKSDWAFTRPPWQLIE